MTRAPYSPPALREWVQSQFPQPLRADIDHQRFMLRRGVHNDGLDTASSSDRGLHHQFCLGKEDRNLAWNEGIGDVHDAVTGLGRLADVLFVGFAIRPEWNPSQPLTPSNIDVEFPELSTTVTKLKDIVQRELGVPHLLQFRHKLHQLQPGPGYVLDPETRQAVVGNINLATAVDRSGSSRLDVLPSSATTPHHTHTNSTSAMTLLRTTPAHHVTHTSTSASPTPRRSTPASASLVRSNASPQSRLSPTSSFQRFNEAPRYADIPAGTVAIRDERSGHFIVLTASSTSSLQERHLRDPALTSSSQEVGSARHGLEHFESLPQRRLRDPALTSSLQERRLGEPSWIRTPHGTPPGNDLLLSPPPAYYTHVTTSTFNFSPTVHAYLQGIEATLEVMLRIDASLDYSVDDWETCFVDAGLSVSQARNLRQVIVHSLPEEQISVLDIAQQSDRTRR
ncbi:hypothetical protein F4604DRAFT_1950679 [Suillus subluteus]|nr:hypothetical protein F4604DRAFT_1950679 [Suillus subluteus]